jgi:hypothetical protein
MDELYGPESLPQIVCILGLAGGGAAWLAGRAVAATWRSPWHAIGYMLLLGAAVRFVHFALFGAPLGSLPGYVADTAYVVAVACLAWRLTRTQQMVTQYPWLYIRSSPMTWRDRPPERGDRHLDAVRGR